jgi:hypothetical protein
MKTNSLFSIFTTNSMKMKYFLTLFRSLCFVFIMLSTNYFLGQTPQLRSVDCYRNNVLLDQILSANPIGAVGYRFEFTNLELGQTVTLDKTTRNITIQEFPTISRYNCNYQVRVAINTGSGFGSFGPICTINSTPLLSNLRSADCGKNLLALNSPVYSNLNPIAYPNTDYWDFEVRRLDDFSVSEQVLNRPNHEFNLTMTSNPLFQQAGTTYQVRVRTSQSGILQPWGTWCSITTPSVGPIITWGCNQTLEYLSYQNITCSLISGATQYEFMLRQGSNLLGTKSNTTNSIKLDAFVNGSNIPLYNYGSTYRMAVRALVNGVWTGWSSLCYIYTTNQPHTEVMNQCGNALAAFTTKINFYAIANASYQYELTDLTGGTYDDGVQTFSSGIRMVSLNQFSRWSWGHEYSIRCRVVFKGITYAYSNACIIKAPNPICGLRSADCPKTLSSSGAYVSSIIMTTDNPVNVTAYQYKIGNTISPPKYGTAGRNITLQEILGSTPTPNTTYPIQVRVIHEGIAQEWGWICNVTTPSAIMVNDDFGISEDNTNYLSYIHVQPNPTEEEIKVELIKGDEMNYHLTILNLNGQIIDDFHLSTFESSYNTKITSNSGIYFLRIYRGDALIETRKIIKL